MNKTNKKRAYDEVLDKLKMGPKYELGEMKYKNALLCYKLHRSLLSPQFLSEP